MTDSNKSISPLRQRMIEDMTMRKLSPKTQSGYIRAVKKLTRFLGRSPATASPEDLRHFQLHQVESGVSSITLNATITGLRFFFEVTLDRGDAMAKMSHVHEPRKR
jgi:site-specific recombinase XerD